MSSYLQSSKMVATSNTMALAAQVLGFDIIELWSQDSNGNSSCTFIHAAEELVTGFHDIICGPYPARKDVVHTISPKLYALAQKSTQHYYWHTIPPTEILERKSANPASFYSNVRTEFAYVLKREATDSIVYIVGFSFAEIECTPPKLEFLSGLGYAIYVAAYDLDEKDDGQLSESRTAELDKKEIAIRDPSKIFTSSLNLSGLIKNVSNESMSSEGHEKDVGLSLESPPQSPAKPPSRSRNASQESIKGMVKVSSSLSHTSDGVTWDANEHFSYPVFSIPIKHEIPDSLTLDAFKEVKHLADGSNANVFCAIYRGDNVVIKMIKKEVQYDPIALHEFDAEQGLLSRISHPNIIKILGSGRSPRRFIVLEYLGGGSLSGVLHEARGRNAFAKVFFRRPSFTYEALLNRAKDIAEALDYMHARCHPGATFVHRDLKPDNVGFTADGTLKLFDLGLCTCVKRRTDAHIAYEMTGNTGSLRYMAPEVALRKAYTEKVDVYSFGIMLWQMATDKVPFKGYAREQFMGDVVSGKLRPKLDSSWPAGFSNLLTACWHNDPAARPSFAEIIIDLNSLIGDNGIKKRGRNLRPSKEGNVKFPSASSWF